MSTGNEHLRAIQDAKRRLVDKKHEIDVLKNQLAIRKTELKDLEAELATVIDEGPGLFDDSEDDNDE